MNKHVFFKRIHFVNGPEFHGSAASQVVSPKPLLFGVYASVIYSQAVLHIRILFQKWFIFEVVCCKTMVPEPFLGRLFWGCLSPMCRF